MGQTCCCIQVGQSKVGIKEKWGKFDEVLDPGFHCVNWCTGKKVKRMINLRLQQIDVKCQTKTKDNVFLIVAISVQYRISPTTANQAYYKLIDPRLQLRSFILDVITSTIPKMSISDVYDMQDDISKAAETYLQKEMALYGMEIVRTLIVEVFPDEIVNQSFHKNKSSKTTRNGEQVDADEVLNKLANSFDALLEHFKAKDRMQQRLLDIEERNAQLLERQVTLEKEQLQVAKESLIILAQVEKQKTDAFTEVLNTLASSISGLIKTGHK